MSWSMRASTPGRPSGSTPGGRHPGGPAPRRAGLVRGLAWGLYTTGRGRCKPRGGLASGDPGGEARMDHDILQKLTNGDTLFLLAGTTIALAAIVAGGVKSVVKSASPARTRRGVGA